jgi:hypothetical protein
MKSNLDNLKLFLAKHRAQPEEQTPTHQSWGTVIQGVFHIGKEDIKEFTNLYSKAVVDNHLSILEIQKEYSPILIDIDLRHLY